MERKKTILFIIHRLGYGGAEKMLTFTANALAERGYQVLVYTYEDTSRHYPLHPDIRHITEERIARTRGVRRLIQLFQIRKVIKREKPSMVISFLNYPNLLTILAKLSGSAVPVVISERGDPYQYKGVFENFRSYMYRFADGWVFQTEGARDFFNSKIRSRGSIIPNPVIVEQTVHSKQKHREIAFVARFEMVQKRQDIMVQAFRKVVDRYPDMTLVFYGDGPDEQRVREMVEKLNLVGHVRFEGMVSNISERISTALMFVLTSDYEGIPNALIEAMAAGLPVIATDCSPGGARLLIENKKNGILVPRGDVDGVAQSVIYLIENEQARQDLGLQARNITERFHPSKIQEMWEDYINQILGEKHAG
ncbi:glycosyltransferase family 4 protein [Xylanibacillus composti]|uniref:Amylovoran biosynthesis protein AmsD n=1 Tax=Xylanibacillus composti TaxID=1572762 RepID=A0A8J4M2K2_9BACL|nr:glycosyltransferase [Xylanibacillus composti]MDT9724506.1 glycosyltransferase family 4 protein [Xylanibacillus composti]GIQ69769.1 amylovoran biosynthesis protein AmsD [Xylanibacillus composti]